MAAPRHIDPRGPVGGVSARFHTTHWSQVLAAGDLNSEGGQEAMAALFTTYWYPLYAYVRGCGFSPEDAQDVTQSFFEHWVESDALASADRDRGRFRWFLLKSLRNSLRNEMDRNRAKKRGGGVVPVSWDALEGEQRFKAEPVDEATPDLLFDRRWARAAMGRALERLSEEYSRSGRAVLFQHLKRFLAGHPAAGGYGEIASRLGLSETALKVTVHRMRQRYRDLVRWEVAQTVADPAELDDELRHLLQLLADFQG